MLDFARQFREIYTDASKWTVNPGHLVDRHGDRPYELG